ncbi:MAG TPA: hypothetical protein VF784_17225 [Anaerolineales bacterium]
MPLLIGIWLLAACNFGGVQTKAGTSVQELASTMVAATMTARASGEAAMPLASPASSATATTRPMLFINTNNAKCRSGPGTDFKVVVTFPAGASVLMIARDNTDGYWIVQDPATDAQCWVQAQDSTPSGSFEILPEITPQAITVTVPNKPNRGAWNFNCDNTTLTTILGWNAPSGPVNGYRIYRQGNQIADVPASQTTYTDKVPFKFGSSMAYAVAAYNDAGLSQQAVWNFHCPP